MPGESQNSGFYGRFMRFVPRAAEASLILMQTGCAIGAFVVEAFQTPDNPIHWRSAALIGMASYIQAKRHEPFN